MPAKNWYKTRCRAAGHSWGFQDLKALPRRLQAWNSYACLRRFMDTKGWSFCQISWAEELSSDTISESIINRVRWPADALSCFPQRSIDREEDLWVENTQILHRLVDQHQLFGSQSLQQYFYFDSEPATCTKSSSVKHVFPPLRQFWDTEKG